jgi:hypothetical protein
MDGNGDALVQALGLSYRRPSRGDAVGPTAPAELRPLAAPWRGQPDIHVGRPATGGVVRTGRSAGLMLICHTVLRDGHRYVGGTIPANRAFHD